MTSQQYVCYLCPLFSSCSLYFYLLLFNRFDDVAVMFHILTTFASLSIVRAFICIYIITYSPSMLHMTVYLTRERNKFMINTVLRPLSRPVMRRITAGPISLILSQDLEEEVNTDT